MSYLICFGIYVIGVLLSIWFIKYDWKKSGINIEEEDYPVFALTLFSWIFILATVDLWSVYLFKWFKGLFKNETKKEQK